MASIFTKIIKREIPADILYEDDMVIAFRDIHPQAPVHILIVTKKEIPTVNDVAVEDTLILGRLFAVAAQLARENNVADSGYRLMVNTNADAGQEVFHMHMHLLGGRPLGPMLVKTEGE